MDWLDDHPGHPLGAGYPTGLTLRDDGQSHREAWASIVRRDPCSYCGGPGGTYDHIEPKSQPARTGARAHECLPALDQGGVHSWVNYAGACTACNGRKAVRGLLHFFAIRRGHAC